MAELLLCRTLGSARSLESIGYYRRRGRARAKHSTLEPTENNRNSRGSRARRARQHWTLRNRGRGRAFAPARGVSQPGHVVAGEPPAHRGGPCRGERGRAVGSTPAGDEVVAAPYGTPRLLGFWVSCVWRVAGHGWVAQLEPKSIEWPPDTGAPELHGIGARRSRRARASRGRRS